ncbi:MAG: carbamoyl-phosphate synthase large subunit [Deltaproteobacteria bacterium]|nr:carbamoyl-phosphate synthase large subunit [Deltaproteobacteria bacterium]
MPRRKDIRKIVVLGSGPIIIGQACEFDYSGTQAIKALKQEGFEVILVNSNPATIMTDPKLADHTYIEPLTPDFVARILEKEGADALLPTVGGQTGINVAVALAESGVLDKFSVKLIGAPLSALKLAEDRKLFSKTMKEIGLETPRGRFVHSVEEAMSAIEDIGLPAILRPAFTLGGEGGGIARTKKEYISKIEKGLDASPISQVLVEESIVGWKEYELEVMADHKGNAVIVCSIENIDAMGVHTGDSITVAPAQTLTDKEYQRMRDAAISVLKAVGVSTGGSNVQFAINPDTGRMVVIEMNPRVSRSSALASKATGFPIAKIAAKLAAGYTLDEIPNEITRKTPACFEPMLDYVVVKIPRWTFEKFPATAPILGTQMRSVGEVMAIGRTFKNALQKAMRSLETGAFGLGGDAQAKDIETARLMEHLEVPNWKRILYVRYALQAGMSVDEISMITKIDPWFLAQIEQLVNLEGRIRAFTLEELPEGLLKRAKRWGYSDQQVAELTGSGEDHVRAKRKKLHIEPTYHLVDTCAAEFESYTPYIYSSYETEDEGEPTGRKKAIILGSGPNRIGQGIEFDACCVHAVQGLSEIGIETIMVNCNPETVSTDFDTADRLYFEPLTLEDILNIVEREKPAGVIVQFGGQTPLKLAMPLKRLGVPILGTDPEAIDLAEDRERFGKLVRELGLKQPRFKIAYGARQAEEAAREIGFPVLVRPSYVLGGRAMAVVHEEEQLARFMNEAAEASGEHPILIDRFLEDAFEVDVDAVSDGERVIIGGIMQHIEEAGIHSGDSACVIPPYLISMETQETMKRQTRALGLALKTRGLMNIQFAIKDDEVYILEVNPRASRTIPFVSKATGLALAKVAAKVAAGYSLKELGIVEEPSPVLTSVKVPVFPFSRFPDDDTLLGPEMRSTGEVMGIGRSFGEAFAKAKEAEGQALPMEGTVFISVNDSDKPNVLPIAGDLANLGFRILATAGTALYLESHGIRSERIFKVNEGKPDIVDEIAKAMVNLVINTPLGKKSYFDERAIRRAAVRHKVPLITTLSGARAAVDGIMAQKDGRIGIYALQDVNRGKTRGKKEIKRR